MKDIKDCKRILIVGDSGRGKSTMAEFLGKNLKLKHKDLDDFFWEKKFTIKREKSDQLEMVRNFLKENSNWVIEGTTRDMASLCMEDADIIIHMWFKYLLDQLICISKRSYKGKERFGPYFDLCFTTILKRYKLGKRNKGEPSVKELISKYSDKVISLSTWEEINKFKDSLI